MAATYEYEDALDNPSFTTADETTTTTSSSSDTAHAPTHGDVIPGDVIPAAVRNENDAEVFSGNVCRICYGNSDGEVLLNPCRCAGSVQYSHETCLMTWLKSGATESTTCEICQFPYKFQKYIKPWGKRTHPNITLWHLGWVFKELVVLDWFHFLETVFICISLVVINRMSSYDLVYQFALIGLVEFLYYTLNIFSCFFLLYHDRWAKLNMKVIVLNYDDADPTWHGYFFWALDKYSALLKRNKRLKLVVDQINAAEGEE